MVPLRRIWIHLFVSAVFCLQGKNGGNGTACAGEKPGGEIRGKITITARMNKPEIEPRMGLMGRYPTHGESETAQAAPREAGSPRLSELAAVYLEGGDLDQAEYALPSKKPVLNQKNLQFHPQVLPILVGSTVDFPNRDNLFHNVFSYSSPKEFDLGRYPKDDSRSVTFDRPGTIRVYCDIHSHMAASILVLSNPFFATPADDGTFVIPDVPEGKYRIVLWFDRGIAERRAIEVEAGKTITADFTY